MFGAINGAIMFGAHATWHPQFEVCGWSIKQENACARTRCGTPAIHDCSWGAVGMPKAGEGRSQVVRE